MEDMERYGDYDDREEYREKKSGVFGLVIKILIAVACFSVAGFLIFRIWMMNYYPKDATRFIYTENLTEYYSSVGGNIDAKTQNTFTSYSSTADAAIRNPFFFATPVYVTEADHLQVTLKFNTALYDEIYRMYGIEIDKNANPEDIFDFKLVKTKTGYEDSTEDNVPTEEVGALSGISKASFMVYEYYRVAFDGVDFGLDEGETAVAWFRLDVTLKGSDKVSAFTMPVYFKEYELRDYPISSVEVPK